MILASNNHQLVMLVLAQGTQPGQCLILGAAAPTHHDADRPVDDASRLKADCSCAASRCVCANTCAFCTATAAGTA